MHVCQLHMHEASLTETMLYSRRLSHLCQLHNACTEGCPQEWPRRQQPTCGKGAQYVHASRLQRARNRCIHGSADQGCDACSAGLCVRLTQRRTSLPPARHQQTLHRRYLRSSLLQLPLSPRRQQQPCWLLLPLKVPFEVVCLVKRPAAAGARCLLYRSTRQQCGCCAVRPAAARRKSEHG